MSNSSKQNSLISVIVPFKNREVLLWETLETVLNQTCKDIEIILVDDGSEKDFEPLIKQKLAGRAFKYIKTAGSQGPGYSRQKGFEVSSGDYVVYLDSDDLLESSMFQKCRAVLSAHPEYGMCYVASAEFHNRKELKNPEALEIRKRSNVPPCENLIIDMLTRRRIWDTSACFWRRSALNLFAPWINNFQMEDYAYDMQIQAQGVKVINIPEVLCYYRRHPDSLARSLKPDLPFQKLTMLVHVSNYVYESRNISRSEKNEIQKIIACQILKTYRDGAAKIRDCFLEPLNPGVKFIVNFKPLRRKMINKIFLRFSLYGVLFNG